LLVDTHCHLNFDSFAEDREAVIDRARQAGIEFILNPGIDLPTSREAIALAERYPEVYAAVGVHPNDARVWGTDGPQSNSTLVELREMAQHPKVVAVGEIGLDYYWDQTPHDLQQRIFRLQLELAAEAGLPVILHSRDKAASGSKSDSPASAAASQAIDDLLVILAAWQMELKRAGSTLADRPGVLHSFSAGETHARRAVDLNFRIGITGPVTFKNAAVMQQVAAAIPLEWLLIETDAPFLTPHPQRGQRNEPAYVRFVAEKISQLRSLHLDAFEESVSENAERLFHWRVTH
jgi:TatD DNase family protein